MIAVVDYGLGNLRAFANMLNDLRLPHCVTGDPDILGSANHLILPGVGHFDKAMELLGESGLVPVLEQRVLAEGTPLLGVCVGMQMLATSSEEGARPGLGWIKGDVVRFPCSHAGIPLPIPHMGWNDVTPLPDVPLFRSAAAHPRFYFLHSFHFRCQSAGSALATADYGGEFPCAVGRDNVFGVQFHPEKSHGWGASLLADFAAL